MNDYREQIAGAVGATLIRSPTTFAWFGKSSPRLPASIIRSLTPQIAPTYLGVTLRSQLYSHFFCTGAATPAPEDDHVGPLVSDLSFGRELSKANRGRGYVEPDWTVHAMHEDAVVVRRFGLDLWVDADQCELLGTGVIAVGATVALNFPKELRSISPGFYMAMSDRELAEDDSTPLTRIYWHLTAEGAVHFMRLATSKLNRAGLAFKLKVLDSPAAYTRSDAVVLYIRKCDYDPVSEIFARVYPDLAPYLGQSTPALTKALAPGVAVADDPGRGESFGLNRCGLIAEGLLRAQEEGRRSLNVRVEAVVARFAQAGLSVDEPFLCAGGIDRYNFKVPKRNPRRPTRCKAEASFTDLSAEACTATSIEIGTRLTRSAMWHHDRCNWLGVEPLESDLRYGQGMTYRALGPELYAGTSGVALFLAELYRITGHPAVRRTAIGAIRQALQSIETLPSTSNLGYYTGRLGVSFAAWRVATSVGEEWLQQRAAQNVQRCLRESSGKSGYDLLSGSAGAIVALVRSEALLGRDLALDLAVQLADDLLDAADKSDRGFSWRSPVFRAGPNLTGLSHGVAGIAYALLEIFEATGDARYRTGAEQAFAYERCWFDTGAGNWRDLRGERGRGTRTTRPPTFMTFWCHGAPGIALSRIRGYQVLGDDACRLEAEIALVTTQRKVEEDLQLGIGNYSLCHGLAGNADVVLHGARVLSGTQADGVALAQAVACAGIESCAKLSGGWPCGTPRGETPSLMLGLAGIGLFYLRLHDDSIPTVLIPAAWASAHPVRANRLT